MALQTKSISADGSKKHHKFTLTINEDSTNIADNTSTISWSFVLSPIAKGYDWENLGNIKYTVSINGKTYSGSIRNYNGTSTITIADGSDVCNHEADGAKIMSFGFSVTDGAKYSFTPGNASSNGTMTLTSIPRKATILTAPDFNDEENPTFTYSNPAGSAVTSLQAAISFDGVTSQVSYRTLSLTGTSYTFNITDKEREALRKGIKTGISSPIRFVLKTVIGEKTLYHTAIKTFTLLDADPILTTVIEDIDDVAPSLTGGNNTYIKGYSDLKVTMNAEAKKMSSIESYSAKLGSEELQGQEVVFKDIKSDNLITSCKDTRNLIDTNTSEDNIINLINYFKPTINTKDSITMDGEITAKVAITINGTFFNDSFGAVNNNIDVFIEYTGSDGWESLIDNLTINGNNYSTSFNIDNLDYSKSFSYKVKVVDKLDKAETINYTLRMIPVFDWGENDFNFNVPVSFNQRVMRDFVVEHGVSDVWKYRKWDSGFVECYTTVQLTTAFTNQWGSMYQSDDAIDIINYPFEFQDVPAELVTLSGGSTYAAWLYAVNSNRNVLTQTSKYKLCRPTTATNSDFYISYYICGMCKQ